MSQTEPRAPLRIIACDAGRPMAEHVAGLLGEGVTPGEESWFACGEGKYTIGENIRGADAYVFQAPVAPSDVRSVYDRFLMLLHTVEAAALADAEYITAVLPYFPGARQDKRKGRVREGISAGLFARLLQAAGATRVITVELHNEAIAGMFHPGLCRLENIYIHQRLAPWLVRRSLCGGTVAAPDVGGMERARRLAAELSADLVALSKERDYTTVNRVLRATLIGDVSDRDVLLVDDIIDTAGSVCAAVEELKARGARGITVACAHALLSGPAWDRLGALADRAAREGWSFQVVGTSSVDHPSAPEWYCSYPIAPLLAEVISHINQRGSVTSAQAAQPGQD